MIWVFETEEWSIVLMIWAFETEEWFKEFYTFLFLWTRPENGKTM